MTCRKILLGLSALSLALTSGCFPPFNDVIVGENGEQIRLVLLSTIVDNPDLLEEEKRQQIRDLGITDEVLIDLLIRQL